MLSVQRFLCETNSNSSKILLYSILAENNYSFTIKQMCFQRRFIGIGFALMYRSMVTKSRPRLFINQSVKVFKIEKQFLKM